MNIKNILLPFDGSTYSVSATYSALDLAKRYNAHVTVVYVYDEWDPVLAEVPGNLVAQVETVRQDEAGKVLSRADGIFEDEGVEYTLETVRGRPGDILVGMAKSEKFDMIVMGSHGHSDIAGLFLGSVTHKVLNTIYCPVLIVP